MHIAMMKKTLFGFVGILLLQSFSNDGLASSQNNTKALASTTPIVQVDTGRLEGSKNKSVLSFKGIPFAAAPVGQWR